MGFLFVASGRAVLGHIAMTALGQVRAFQVNASSNLVPSLLNRDKARAGALRVQRAERALVIRGQRGDEAGAQAARESVDVGWKAIDEF